MGREKRRLQIRFFQHLQNAEFLDGSTFPPTRVIEIVDGGEQVFDYNKWNLIKQQGKEVQGD
jgi:hypothetical protein